MCFARYLCPHIPFQHPLPIATYRLRCLSGSLSAPLLTTNNRLRCRSGSLSAPLLGRLSSTTNNRPGASQGSLSALQSEYTPLYPVDPVRVLILGFHRFCHTSGALSGSPSVARSGHTPPTRVTRPESESQAPHPPAPPWNRIRRGVRRPFFFHGQDRQVSFAHPTGLATGCSGPSTFLGFRAARTPPRTPPYLSENEPLHRAGGGRGGGACA